MCCSQIYRTVFFHFFLLPIRVVLPRFPPFPSVGTGSFRVGNPLGLEIFRKVVYTGLTYSHSKNRLEVGVIDLRETRIDGKPVYQGKIVNVRLDRVSLPDGSEATREVVEHPGGVAVVALTGTGEVLTVRQFRYPFGEITQEIPAGKLEKGEEPANCALRELREETGYDANHLFRLGTIYASPGIFGEKLHLFLATGLSFSGQQLDKGEFLSVESTPLVTLIRRAANNDIKDAKTIVGLMLAREHLSFRENEDDKNNPDC